MRRVPGLLLLTVLGVPGCAPLMTRPRGVTTDSSVRLHDHSLTLHLTRAAAPTAPSVLLVYATGDAGWWGKDRELYDRLSSWGYASVGFSAREYVRHLGVDALLPAEVADDYSAIIRRSEASLGLPESTPTVLIGKSRGAGLAVAAAGSGALRSPLAGVLAVGLTGEEEYVHRLRRGRPRQLVMLQTYSYLPRLGATPVMVIQSTRDSYVPADEARRLFGADTPVRELVAIDAEDHNFGGALTLVYATMERSLEWMLRR
ncbi:MAG: AcvB/VirJ family lysyl-phosphatidylglycerol hydrolase [Acidobacteriota bacterium]